MKVTANKELRRKPEETEDLIHAIRHDRVDGFVAGRLQIADGLWWDGHVDQELQPTSSIVSSSARLAAYLRASSMSAASR